MSKVEALQTVNYLMALDEQGVVVHSDADVLIDSITEWIDTPRGSVFGNPSWGNELHKFKHEAMNEDLAVSVENSISRGLIRDLGGIASVVYVDVNVSEFDRYQVVMKTPYGSISRLI